jgi:hypothetical protein
VRSVFILFLLIYVGVSNPLYSNGNPLIQLEDQIRKNLDTIHFSILEINDHISQLTLLLNSQVQNKKKSAEIQKDIQTEIKKRDFIYKKQNSYFLLLSMTRQLPFKSEKIAVQQIKDIKDALSILKKNKLPKLTKSVHEKNQAFLRAETELYSQEISSWCQILKNPEGTIIANAFDSFFEYTDPRLSTHFKERDFIECKARFIKTKKNYFLELKYILHSPQASKVYGNIDGLSHCRMDFINGDFVYLETFATTDGVLDSDLNTVYLVQYKLEKEEINKILKNQIDKLTVFWTSGVDEYQISRLNLLQNMFECIQKRKLQN